MTTTRIASTPVAQSVILTDSLTASGWTAKRSQARDGEQISQSTYLNSPSGSAPVRLLVVNYPHNGGQLAEFTCEPTRGTGKWSSSARFYWRMSVFDAPAIALLDAAQAAGSDAHGPTFDTATWEGWEVCFTNSVSGHLQSSTFVHPTGQVTATYHYPVAPGECGGWLISAPTCYADATGHTPGPVVRTLAQSLLVH